MAPALGSPYRYSLDFARKCNARSANTLSACHAQAKRRLRACLLQCCCHALNASCARRADGCPRPLCVLPPRHPRTPSRGSIYEVHECGWGFFPRCVFWVGSAPNADRTACSTCPAGTSSNGTACEPCTGWQVSAAGAASETLRERGSGSGGSGSWSSQGQASSHSRLELKLEHKGGQPMTNRKKKKIG